MANMKISFRVGMNKSDRFLLFFWGGGDRWSGESDSKTVYFFVWLTRVFKVLSMIFFSVGGFVRYMTDMLDVQIRERCFLASFFLCVCFLVS